MILSNWNKFELQKFYEKKKAFVKACVRAQDFTSFKKVYDEAIDLWS